MLANSTDLGKVKCFVDPMDNNANKAYAALPERLFILYEGKLAYLGGVGPFFHNVAEIETWLTSCKKSQPSSNLDILKSHLITRTE